MADCLVRLVGWKYPLLFVTSAAAAHLIVTALPMEGSLVLGPGFHEWPMPLCLFEPQENEEDNHDNPEDIVSDDTAVSGTVLPAKQGVEDTPATTTVQLRIAAVDMPDAVADIVGAWTGSVLGSVAASRLVPGVGFQEPDALGEETRGHQVQETGADDEEHLQGGHVAALVNDEAYRAAGEETANRRQWDGGSLDAQADTTDEDNGFNALTQNRDEWKEEHGILLGPILEAFAEFDIRLLFLFGLESTGELYAPLGLHLGDAQEGSAHDGDDDGGDDCEHTLPDVFGRPPGVGPEAIKCPDHPGAYDQTYA